MQDVLTGDVKKRYSYPFTTDLSHSFTVFVDYQQIILRTAAKDKPL